GDDVDGGRRQAQHLAPQERLSRSEPFVPATERLTRYHAKRHFDVTREPRGGSDRAAARALSFVIQRHEARRLHYDFRLEWDGVLVSWAVPKGPSLDPDIKRLAMHVEDHPIEYGGFEGNIPAGQYGAGHVDIWDAGTWEPLDTDAGAALAKGHLKFRLAGERLHGDWILIRTGMGGGRNKDAWILRKLDDADAQAGHDAEADPGPLGQRVPAKPAPRAAKAPTAAGVPPAARSKVVKATKAELPASLDPQRATLVDRPPQGAGWIYEVKYDGYRMLTRVAGGKRGDIKLTSRNGRDWLGKLPHIVAALKAAGLPACWLDGEIIVPTRDGSDFQALQNALSSDSSGVLYMVFDVPFWNGRDLRAAPLAERRQALQDVAARLPAEGPIRLSEVVSEDGEAAYGEACRLGLEGLIGKRLDAPYTATRSTAWIKLKCRPRQEFVIGGYSEPAGTRSGLGSLLLGMYEGGVLRYAGRVGTGFGVATLDRLIASLKALERPRCPFDKAPSQAGRATRVHWVAPKLVAEVSFAGWTSEKILRQASFEGLREDKAPREIHQERAMPADDITAPVQGVRISHPDREIFPDVHLRKIDLARYYEAVAEAFMPHLKGRPLSLVRCPQGSEKACFFQKHVPEAPAGAKQVSIALAGEGKDDLVVVERIAGAIGLVQWGAIEFHTWGARTPKLEQPDRITFDLDPDAEVAWKTVVEAAQLTRALLQELKLTPFLKTTGGKGLHIVVPIRATQGWEVVKAFAKGVAEHLEAVMPDRFVASMSKARRRNRVFVDYLRNGREATAIAAYSARARAGASVSMPLDWAELDARHDVRGAFYNIRNVPGIIAGRDDPWAGYDAERRTLSVGVLRRFVKG
ncbi:MAG: DNA ligase D, partial [Rhodocyclaceae bacterium]